jgi:hypothetical protein
LLYHRIVDRLNSSPRDQGHDNDRFLQADAIGPKLLSGGAVMRDNEGGPDIGMGDNGSDYLGLQRGVRSTQTALEGRANWQNVFYAPSRKSCDPVGQGHR